MTDNRTTELLPCPFCGGEARVSEKSTLSTYWIYCMECGAASMFMKTEAEAIAAWNARAERTCRVDGTYYDDLWEAVCTRLSCGHDVWSEAPKFCPECGARIEVGE